MRELTDVVREKKDKRRNKVLYSDHQKMEAVKLWLMCGSPTAVAAALKMDRRTIHGWMNTDWWKRITEEFRTEGRFVLNKKLREIAHKALDVTSDRLTNGDFVFNRDSGEVIRKPISAKDAYRIASDFIDKAEKLENPIKESNVQVNDRLAQLAEAFAQFSKKTTRVEVIDAVYVPREERLLEREEVGISAPEAERGESRADAGSESDGEGGESPQGGQTPGGSYPSSESWRKQLPEKLESDSST